MKHMEHLFTAVVPVLLALSACVAREEICQPEPIQPGDGETVCVSIKILPDTESAQTKSSYDPDETLIHDIGVYAYRDGFLAGQVYSDDLSSELSIELVQSVSYNVYSLANFGEEISLPELESELEAFTVAAQPARLDGCGIPMAAALPGITADEGEDVVIPLVRLYAKFGFSVDNSHLSEGSFEFGSACIRQVSSYLGPFASGGYAALVAGSVTDGDVLTASDLSRLNNGEELFFYVPENMQGTLLPLNSDPWKKVPAYMSGKEGICTYLEAGSSYSGTNESGTVTFRFYLGTDNCSNFDVERNSVYHVVLYPEDDPAGTDSWKISADVTVDDPGPIGYTLSAPAYVAEWGTLIVPDDGSGNDVSVTVSSGSSSYTFTLGASTATRKYVGRYEFRYLPAEPTKLYLMPSSSVYGGYAEDELPSFTISRGGASVTVPVTTNPQYPDFVLQEALDICEDGQAVDEYVGLSVDLSKFITPSCIMETMSNSMSYKEKKWFYLQSYFRDDCGWNLCLPSEYDAAEDPSTYTNSTDYATVYDATTSIYSDVYEAWDDGVFAVVRFHGLSAASSGTEQYFIAYHDSLYDIDDNYCFNCFPFTVRPAFPDQRYIGEYVNMQLAPGSAAATTTDISFEGGSTGWIPSSAADWEVRHTTLHPDVSGEDNLASYWGAGSEDDYTANLSMTRQRLSFGDDFTTGFFPSGAMVARGHVTNAYTGREIYGYYTFDLVLYVTVGLQCAQNGKETKFCITPFNSYATNANYDAWSGSFPAIYAVYQELVSGTYQEREAQIYPPEYADTAQEDWYWSVPHSGSSVNRNTPFSTLSALYAGLNANGLLDFEFRTYSTETDTSLDIIRDSWLTKGIYSPYKHLHDGTAGYYRVYRQCDVGGYSDTYSSGGLQNTIIECWKGSFATW